MSISKTITINLDHSYTLELQLTESSTSQANNTSTISWALVLKSGTPHFSDYRIGWSVSFNGTVISEQAWASASYRSISANSSLTIVSGTRTVTHNTDGTMTLAASASMTISKSSYSPINGSSGTGTRSLSGTMTLTPLAPPSYPVITNCYAYRCNSSGTQASNGTYLKLYCAGYVSGTGTFSVTYSTTLPASGSLTNGTASVIGSGNYSVTQTYGVTITASDGNGNSVVRSFNIPTELITFHMKEGGTAVAFSTYATEDETVNFGTWHPFGYVFGLGKAKKQLYSENLNSITIPGIYGVSSNSDASGLTNCPSSYAGTLRVWNGNGAKTIGGTWHYVMQEYVDINGDIYIRGGNSDSTVGNYTWKTWKHITAS